jgi:serine/threonine protein kinase
MNDVEIDILKKMLDMDPHSRINAREAIEHDYFDELRAKDPEYNPPGPQDEYSQNSTREAYSQRGMLRVNNNRIVSPELQQKKPHQNSKSQNHKTQQSQVGKGGHKMSLNTPEMQLNSVCQLSNNHNS